MRQRDGSDLLGANDPRNATIGIIDVAPDDDRQSVLAAILTQDKLGRQQTIVVLPDQSRAFSRAVDFDGLRNMRRDLQTRVIFVVPKGSGIAELARQRGFSVFSSLEQFTQSFQKTESALGVAQAQREQTLGRKQKSAATDTSTQASPSTPTPGEVGSEEDKDGLTLTAPVAQEDQGPLASSEPSAEPAPPVPEVDRTPADEANDGNVPPPVPVPAVVQPGSPSATSGSHTLTDASQRGRRRWLIAGVILLLLLLVGTVALRIAGGASPLPTIFPGAASSASVSITPDRNDLKHTYTILAVTRAPDAAQREVEARFMSSATPSQSMTVKATGIGTIPAVQAQGILTFYNALPYAQTIAVGTVFTDANGIQVVNDQSAVIPAAQPPSEGSAIASAHVVTAGASGNIPAFDFNTVSCCFSGVTVANTTAFHGGQDPLRYSFVQQSDIDGAANSLKTALTPNAQKALQAQVLPNEQLITPVRCVPGVVSDHAAGDTAASVTVTVTVTCVGEVYDRQGAQSLAASLLRTDGTKTPGAGYMLMGNIVTTVTKTAVIDTKGTISILVNAEGMWVYQFTDAQKGALARLIAGKREDDAQALLLQQKGVSKANISVSGGTDNTLPTDPHSITIVVQSLPGLHGTTPQATGLGIPPRSL